MINLMPWEIEALRYSSSDEYLRFWNLGMTGMYWYFHEGESSNQITLLHNSILTFTSTPREWVSRHPGRRTRYASEINISNVPSEDITIYNHDNPQFFSVSNFKVPLIQLKLSIPTNQAILRSYEYDIIKPDQSELVEIWERINAKKIINIM